MNERSRTGPGQSSGRRHDPIVGAISDSLDTGYQALEYVLEALRASIERRPGTASVRRRGGARQGARVRSRYSNGADPDPSAPGPAAPAEGVTQVVQLIGELLERAGDVAQVVAKSIADLTWLPEGMGLPTLLADEVAPGKKTKLDYRVWNTSSDMLSKVRLVSTDLIGDEGRIPASAVKTEPREIERIQPYRGVNLTLVVSVPPRLAGGTYRGVVRAEPGDAWAVVELNVERAKRGARKAKGAPARKATGAPARNATARKATARKATARKATARKATSTKETTSARKTRAKKAGPARARKAAKATRRGAHAGTGSRMRSRGGG